MRHENSDSFLPAMQPLDLVMKVTSNIALSLISYWASRERSKFMSKFPQYIG